MRNCRPYRIIVLLFLITLLFPVPACITLGNGQQASPVSEVVLSSKIDSQSKPLDASNVFTVMAEVIYLSLKLTDAPANTAVMAKLTYVSGEVSSMANSTLYSNTQTAQGTRYLSFAMKPPPGGFPAGSYQVTISANGKEQAGVPFTVENLRAQKVGPVIKKFTVDRNTIPAGKSVTLSWEVSDATRVTLQPEIGTVPTSGTRSITPTSTATYTLIASSDAGSTTGELIINVGAALVGAPDLVITQLWLEGCMVYYKVKNAGTRDSTPTYTYVYVDDMFPPLGGSSFVDVLKPGEEKGMQFSSYQWPWCGAGGTPGAGQGGGGKYSRAAYQALMSYVEKLDPDSIDLNKDIKDIAELDSLRNEILKMDGLVDNLLGTEFVANFQTRINFENAAAGGRLPTDAEFESYKQANYYEDKMMDCWAVIDSIKESDLTDETQSSGGSSGSRDYIMMNHTVKACADAKNELEESDKNNNCTSKIWGMLMKYDLLPLAHMATWTNNFGLSPYFGLESGNEGGFIKLGDGSLEVIPFKMPQGFTQGYFGYFSTSSGSLGDVNTGPRLVPSVPIKIPPKTRFFATVGLSDRAQGSDGVTFLLGLKVPSGDTIFLPGKKMTEPGKYEPWVIDLNDYQGQALRFVLRVEAGASPDNDFAIWKEARLEQME